MWATPPPGIGEPLHRLHQGVEDEGSRVEAEWKDAVEVKAPSPLHAQEVVFTGADWAQAESTFDVQLGHEGMATKLHDGVHRIVDSRVPERKLGDVDAVVDAASWWVGEVHDEPPFPRVLLGQGTQRADYEVGEGWYWEGANGVARCAFLEEVLIDYVWACQCRLQVCSIVCCSWAGVTPVRGPE